MKYKIHLLSGEQLVCDFYQIKDNGDVVLFKSNMKWLAFVPSHNLSHITVLNSNPIT